MEEITVRKRTLVAILKKTFNVFLVKGLKPKPPKG